MTTSQAASCEAERSPVPNASNFIAFPTLPATPLQGSLFQLAPDSEVATLIEFGIELAGFQPALLEDISTDLNNHALAKKQQRIDHQRFLAEQTESLMDVPAEQPSKPKLETGRPRMSSLSVLIFLLLRGLLGGCKEQRFRTLVRESISLQIFLENIGEHLPSGSTLNENLNAITNETLLKIHRAELALALGEKLDDFDLARIDSTAARSASAYPTDSGTLAKLLNRMCRRLQRLPRLDLEAVSSSEHQELKEVRASISKLNYQIGTLTSSSAKEAERAAQAEHSAENSQSADTESKKKEKENSKQRLRRELYEQLYAEVEKALPAIERSFLQARSQIEQEQCAPRVQRRRARFLEDFQEDLESVRRGITQSRGRVCEGKKPTAKNKMPLSVSDSSASFIEKGSWEFIFGYRPQIVFSGNNLVTAIIVPEGNASDCSQLIPAIELSIANTGKVPGTVSVDDGYTGAHQLKESLALGVTTVSFSGARGKALLGEDVWSSEPYCAARKARNGAESGIYVLKKKVNFGQLASCGQEKVRGEQYEKVLTYNALKIAALRRKKRREDSVAAHREAA